MPKSKSANRDIDYDDVVTNDMELEEGASEEMDSRWNNRFILISFGKETFGFAPSGTTTFSDLIEQTVNIQNVVSAVISSVEQLEDDEKISTIDFMDCIRDTVKENLVNAAGDPMLLVPTGIGVSIMSISTEN